MRGSHFREFSWVYKQVESALVGTTEFVHLSDSKLFASSSLWGVLDARPHWPSHMSNRSLHDHFFLITRIRRLFLKTWQPFSAWQKSNCGIWCLSLPNRSLHDHFLLMTRIHRLYLSFFLAKIKSCNMTFVLTNQSHSFSWLYCATSSGVTRFVFSALHIVKPFHMSNSWHVYSLNKLLCGQNSCFSTTSHGVTRFLCLLRSHFSPGWNISQPFPTTSACTFSWWESYTLFLPKRSGVTRHGFTTYLQQTHIRLSISGGSQY